VTALDSKSLSKSIKDLKVGREPIVLAGAVGGIFGGEPSLQLSAAIPPITPPPSLNFLVLPKNFSCFFFITLRKAAAEVGISLALDLKVRDKDQFVEFRTSIDFQLETSGGLAISLNGESLKNWNNAMNIKGFMLKPGTRIEIKVDATASITLTLVGISRIGTRDVTIIGSGTVNAVTGTITKGAFQGKVSLLLMQDLIDLTNKVAAASGNPISRM